MSWIVVGLSGAVLSQSSAGQWIERIVVREWVYPLRGIRTTPVDVVVVSMDRSSPDLPAVTRSDRLWSRHLYSTLINKLSAAQAAGIVLDVTFEDEGDEAANAALEASLSNSKRVVIFTRLSRTQEGDIAISPLPRFTSVARAKAVFPLPKSPQVEVYWPFFPAWVANGDEGSFLELPSMPVAALQLRLLDEIGFEPFRGLLDSVPDRNTYSIEALGQLHGDVSLLISRLRRALVGNQLSNQEWARWMLGNVADDPVVKTMQNSLMQVYAGRGMRPLNFYGPPRTIRTIDHMTVLSQDSADISRLQEAVAGKMVFIGHSSKKAVDQLDGIRTVYTRDGLDLSGVEVAATAYANLTDGSTPRLASAPVVVLIHVMIVLLVARLVLRGRVVRAVAIVGILATGYLLVAVMLFSRTFYLLPIGVPLLLLVPLTLFTALLLRYFGTDRQAGYYRHGIQQLLPTKVMSDIESGNLKQVDCEHLHGTCMITDIANYTHYSEEQGHERIADLSREYFAFVMEEIYSSGGELFDVEGDGITAFWGKAQEYPQGGGLAANAAFRILQNVTLFNQRHPDTPFKTRIGLDSGWVEAAYIGGKGNYRYCIIGDVANTSSRLEGLNKRLGTSILASTAVVSNEAGLLLRPVGTFLLKGKNKALDVVEIMNLQEAATSKERALCSCFSKVLELIRGGELKAAQDLLVDILLDYGTDGPARFYLELLNDYNSREVHLLESGVVRVEGK